MPLDLLYLSKAPLLTTLYEYVIKKKLLCLSQKTKNETR